MWNILRFSLNGNSQKLVYLLKCKIFAEVPYIGKEKTKNVKVKVHIGPFEKNGKVSLEKKEHIGWLLTLKNVLIFLQLGIYLSSVLTLVVVIVAAALFFDYFQSNCWTQSIVLEISLLSASFFLGDIMIIIVIIIFLTLRSNVISW